MLYMNMRLNTAQISIIKRLLNQRSQRSQELLKSILLKINPADLSKPFEQINDRSQKNIYLDVLIRIGKAGIALRSLHPLQIKDMLTMMNKDQQIAILSSSFEDDSAYFLSLMNESDTSHLLESLPLSLRSRIKQILSYPEGTAGREMSTKVFTLPSSFSIQMAISEVRKRLSEESIFYIFCVDSEDKLVGVTSLKALVIASEQTPLKDIMKTEIISVLPETSSQEVAELVNHYGFIAMPVVSQARDLLGIISIDNIIDIIKEQTTASAYATAGLQVNDRVYTKTSVSIKNRIPWLFLNLILAILVSGIVSLFENTMSQLIILATLLNVVSGLAGNTAIQTLTVVTRGLAMDDFHLISYAKVIFKEIKVGLVIGIVIGICAGVLVYLWKGHLVVASIIFVSMILNTVVGATVGALVPIILKRRNWDPAMGSGVLVTIITDSFSIFSFLGIAAITIHS